MLLRDSKQKKNYVRRKLNGPLSAVLYVLFITVSVHREEWEVQMASRSNTPEESSSVRAKIPKMTAAKLI